MNRLDRYIAVTVGGMILLASAGLVSLFAIFAFMDQLTDVKNDYTIATVAEYIGYSIPRIVYDTLPFAVLIGCLAGLGILASNNELIVMRSAGISTWQIARATLKPALVFVFLGLLLGELVLPDFERTARVIREDAMEADISPRGGFWYREKNTFMHFTPINIQGDLRNINHYVLDDKQTLVQSIWAESASYSADSGWLMQNVLISSPGRGITSQQLPTHVWETSLTPNLINTEILVEPAKMSIVQLYDKITYLHGQGLNASKFELGFWAKSFQPIASLSLVFIAISFIFGPLRETTMGMRVVSGLMIGIVFKFAQDLLSPASLVFGFSPLIATMIPILVCGGIGFYLLKRAN